MTAEPLFRIVTALLALVGVTFASGSVLSPVRPAKVIAIDVTSKGFAPSVVRVSRREPVTLVFTRKTDRICADGISVQLDPRDADSFALLVIGVNNEMSMAMHFSIRGTYELRCSPGDVRGRIVSE